MDGGRTIPGKSLLVVAMAVLMGRAADRKEIGPVTPAEAIRAAVGSSLKTVQDWIAQKDFASATQAGQELAAITDLYARQGSNPGWKAQVALLREAVSQVAGAIRGRDGTGARKHLDEATRLLGELEKHPPGSPASGAVRPTGSMKTWMFLIDAAYSDAKRADSPRELEVLAVGLAEQMNAVYHLRGDARWRKQSLEVREAAQVVASKAREKDLAGARAALRTVYNRCEACHQAKGR